MGEAAGVPFLALEYVADGSLKERMAGHPVSPRTAAAWVEQMAAAIEHAHQQGIVHRDLKPQNVIVTPTGLVKVLDFGLAKPAPVASGEPVSATAETQSASLTRRGTLVGTFPL